MGETEATELTPGECVLVLAPAGRDAAVVTAMLAEGGLRAAACASIEEFCAAIGQGAGAGVIAQEALAPGALERLIEALARQPPWSDLPLVLLLGGNADTVWQTLPRLEPLGSAALLERPMRRETLLSAVRVALKARRRQYELRDHLRERERAEAALRESDHLFRLALGNSPVRVAHVDRELRFTWMYNPHPDVAPERALGKRLDEILPPEDAAELTQLRQEVLTTGLNIRRQIAVTYPSGRALFDVAAEPLRDAAGSIIGVTTASTDITERRRAEEQQAHLAAIVESSFDAITSRSLDGKIATWNAAAERMFGYTAAEAVGRDIAMLMPPDRPDELAAVRQALEAGAPVPPFETVRLTKDGRRLDVSVTVSPLRSASGRVIGASVITRDISERRRSEEHQKLLLAELSHRVKNTLTVVLSIASQTLSRAQSLADFEQAFRGRIQALAATHSLLTAVNWEAAGLRTLVEQALRPYHSGTDRHIEIRGQDVLLRPDAALTLSLILHELTTNAVKYGALTRPNGRVRVGWALGQAASGQRLRLRWCERGGPPIQRPAKLGFGLYLIERSVAHEFDGGASFDFAQDGLTCEIDVPWTNTIGALWPGMQSRVTWH